MASKMILDRTERRRLTEYFIPCFRLILKFRSSGNYGDPQVLRKKIWQFLEKVKHDTSQAGYDDKDIDQAIYAIIAFIDETVISSTWSGKTTWREFPLQVERYQKFDAGEEFFRKLDNMRRHPAARSEVLEIYQTCLALGFEGKYKFHPPEQLRLLIADTYKEMSRLFNSSPTLLSPRGILPESQIAKPGLINNDEIPVFAYYLLIGAMGIMAYILFYLDISQLTEGILDTIHQSIPNRMYY